MRLLTKSISLFIFLMFLTSVVLAADHPPSTKWRQTKTEHFVLVYPHTSKSQIVNRILQIAEEEYVKLALLLDYQSKSKIYLVLKDNEDQFNGFTTIVPTQLIQINMATALNGSSEWLWDVRSDDYLRLLINHELTHSLHSNTRGGIYKALHFLFGQLFSPNIFFTPTNFVEGLAVYAESTLHHGRGFGTYYDMVLRSDYLENNLKKLDETMTFRRELFSGVKTYLYGYKFLNYLAETYGEETLAQLSHATGKRLPLFYSGAFKKVFKKPLETLWQDWQKTLAPYFEEQIKKLSKDGLSQGETVFQSNGLAQRLLLAKDQSTLYFIWHSQDNVETLVALNLKTNAISKLAKGTFFGNLSLSDDGKTLYYVKLKAYHHFSNYGDVYALNLANKNEKRLTHGLRTTYVSAYGPENLLLVTQDQGESQLVTLNTESQKMTALRKPHTDLLLHNPVVSHIDRTLYILGQNRQGQDALYTLGYEKDSWHKISLQGYWLADLAMAPSGDELFFVADGNGTPNIYAYNLKTQMQSRKTSVLSAAVYPAVSDHDIYSAQYTGKGFVVKKDQRQKSFGVSSKISKPQTISLGADPAVENMSDSTVVALDSTRYNPLKTLIKPFYIVPIFGKDAQGSSLGLFFTGQDVLNHHMYQADVSYGFDAKKMSYEVLYSYSRLWPTFSIGAYDRLNLFNDFFTDTATNTTTDYLEQERGAALSMKLPLYTGYNTNLEANLSYFYADRRNFGSQNLDPVPFTGQESTVALGVNFASLESTHYSLWPYRGVNLTTSVQRSDSFIGSDFDVTKVFASADLYVPGLFKRQTLMIKTKAGVAYGDAFADSAFEMGGDASVALVRPADDFIALSGYGSRIFTGDRFAFGQISYGMPLGYIQRGLGSFPLYFDSVALVGFYEIGSAWNNSTTPTWSDAAGAELQTRFKLMGIPLMLKGKLSHGFRDRGETTFFMGMGASF